MSFIRLAYELVALADICGMSKFCEVVAVL
jgi:hypothetical protein